MHNKYLPPSVKSTVQYGQEKSLGPHHFCNVSSSVHAFHKRFTGALKLLIILIGLGNATDDFSFSVFILFLSNTIKRSDPEFFQQKRGQPRPLISGNNFSLV